MSGLTLLTGLLAEDQKKSAVWNKGRIVPGQNSSLVRMDDFGNIIHFSAYGDRHSAFGWEFDHYPVPASRGGSDDISNLRPLHWKQNASLGSLLGGLRGGGALSGRG